MTVPTYHYGRTTRRCTYEILDIFNTFQIKRYDPSGTVTDTRTVPIRFGPKDKLYEEIYNDENINATENPLHPILSLPRMGLSFDGILPRIGKRATFKGLPLYFKQGESPSGTWAKTYQPIPATLNYSLIMAGKYMDDLLQMYEQVFVWFHPQMFIRMPFDPLALQWEKWPVNASTWTGPNSKGDGYTATSFPIYTAEVRLSVQGWLYRYEDGDAGSAQIHRVSANVYPQEQSAQSAASAYEYDEMVVSAVPSAITAYSGASGLGPSGTGNDADYYEKLTHYMITGA
jgi:hypothetical protein